MVKNLPSTAGDARDLGLIPGKWQPTPVFLLGKFHGQRSLVGYSPWDHKELDTAEQLSTHMAPVHTCTHTHTHTRNDKYRCIKRCIIILDLLPKYFSILT